MTEAIVRIRNDDDALLAEAGERFKAAWKTAEPTAAVFTFSSPAQLFSVISPKRWHLIVASAKDRQEQHPRPRPISRARRQASARRRLGDDAPTMAWCMCPMTLFMRNSIYEQSRDGWWTRAGQRESPRRFKRPDSV